MSTPQPPAGMAAALQGYSEADVARVTDEHDAINKRWPSSEIDLAKLIDFPMMSDVREPLAVAFLQANRDADALRPLNGAEMSAKSRWDDYRNAVNAFVVAVRLNARRRSSGSDVNWTA